MKVSLKDFSLFDTSKCSLGVFDEYTKSRIYNIFRESSITDFQGFVDKDVEDLLVKNTIKEYK